MIVARTVPAMALSLLCIACGSTSFESGKADSSAEAQPKSAAPASPPESNEVATPKPPAGRTELEVQAVPGKTSTKVPAASVASASGSAAPADVTWNFRPSFEFV